MTSPDRFNEVMEIFDRVCDAPPEELSALLGEACHGDDVLRREVETLLDHDTENCEAVAAAERGDGADVFAARLMEDKASEDDPESQQLPESIGQFKILRLIGQGGMGTVYEAEQENPRRRVALKVIRGGLAQVGQLCVDIAFFDSAKGYSRQNLLTTSGISVAPFRLAQAGG